VVFSTSWVRESTRARGSLDGLLGRVAVAGQLGQETLQLEGRCMGGVVIGLDRADGDEMAQIRLNGVGMQPRAPGVVTGGVAEARRSARPPLDVAVEQGDAHGDGGADAEALGKASDQRARQVGHRAHRRRAAGGAVEAGRGGSSRG
jgi:hypothetical protein